MSHDMNQAPFDPSVPILKSVFKRSVETAEVSSLQVASSPDNEAEAQDAHVKTWQVPEKNRERLAQVKTHLEERRVRKGRELSLSDATPQSNNPSERKEGPSHGNIL